ncbi:hypothetical protein BHE74_00031622 [Ensete ventricosum]|nr:hypothetical protein BHE74_00031622 [Ensete ventricosum]
MDDSLPGVFYFSSHFLFCCSSRKTVLRLVTGSYTAPGISVAWRAGARTPRRRPHLRFLEFPYRFALSFLLPARCLRFCLGGINRYNLIGYNVRSSSSLTWLGCAGSSRVARTVMAAAAKHLTPVAVELGGKSPAIFDSLGSPRDRKVAVERIVGAKWVSCAGQACIGVDYVLVEEQFAPVLVCRTRRTAAKLRR